MPYRLAIKNIRTAVEMYYSHLELGSVEIMELFGCSRSTATRLKEMARKVQKERGVLTFSDLSVNTKCAYDAWHIDVQELERRYAKLRKLGEGVKT